MSYPPEIVPVPEKLIKIRERKNYDYNGKGGRYLRQAFKGLDGKVKPLIIRPYQAQGILHLIACPRFLLGDDTGLGKTLEVIAAYSFICDKTPDLKMVVMTTKSAAPQWQDELEKFTTGIQTFLCQGSASYRARVRSEFEQAAGPAVLIMGYRSAVQDFNDMQEWMGHVLVFDEATAFKNPKTQVHQVCRYLGSRAAKVWALTATLIKNHLLEGYGIYQVVSPTIFGPNYNKFMFYFCIVEMRAIPRSSRKIPVVVGYLPERIQEFRDHINAFYLGRPKHEVAMELPSLTTKVIEVKLTPAQESKYNEALKGLLEVGDAKPDGQTETRDVSPLTAITYCQQICNHLQLLDCEGPSEKLNALIDLLTDGEFEDEKVIIFTRFKKMVNLIMPALKTAKVKAVKITGDESGDERRKAMRAFQDPDDATRVVCITMAGSDAINLQAAKAIIFYDTPWSAGDFLQILGRMIRIGSEHDKVYAIHLVARGKKRTVDNRIMEVLSSKMHLVEAVLGQRLKVDNAGIPEVWDGNNVIKVTNDMDDLLSALRQDAKDDTDGE